MFTSTQLPYLKPNAFNDVPHAGKKLQKQLFRIFTTLCLIGAGLLSGPSGKAQFSPANCNNIQCTSNDVRIIKAYISGPNNTPIDCNAIQPFNNAELHLIVSSNTQRIGVSISGSLVTGVSPNQASYPIGKCFGQKLNNGSSNNLVYALGSTLATAQCGTQFSLKDIYTSWGTGNTNFCTNGDPQCPATPAKCRYAPGEVIIIDVKLAVDFDWQVGECASNTRLVSFTSTIDLGADVDATSIQYAWDFDNNGTTDETTANPTHTFDPGTYPVTLTVSAKAKDGTPLPEKSNTKNVVVETCCNLPAPTVANQTFCSAEGKKLSDITPQVSEGYFTWFDKDDYEVDANTIIPVGTTTYWISYSKDGCESDRAEVTVTVTASPVLTITSPDAVCAPATVDITAAAVTAGSTLPDGTVLTYYTDNNGSLGTEISGTDAKTLVGGTYWIVATVSNCSDKKQVTVSVNPQPTASISYSGPYCATGTASVTQTGNTGGSYSATPSGLSIDASTGAINLAASKADTYTVTYQFSNGTCSNTATTEVTVKPLPTASISVGTQTCDGGIAQITLTATTNGTSVQWSKPAGADGSFSSTTTSPTVYTPGPLDRKNGVTITLTTTLDGCTNKATKSLTTTPCGPYYTYTQGYYSSTGTSCTPAGLTKGAVSLVQYALDNMDGVLGNQLGTMYIGKSGASLTINYADAAKLVAIMPGGGSASKLAKDYTLVNAKTTYPPLKNGKISNVLLSQTITLGLNMHIQGDGLGSFVLQNGYLTTQKGDQSTCPISKVVSCSKDASAISSLQLATSTGIKSWISNKTVTDLFNLASAALGGATLPTGVSLTDINNAVDVINRSFDQGRFALGYYPTQQSCGSFATTTSTTTMSAVKLDLAAETPTSLAVSAYPNPFSSNVRFTVANPKAGRGSLEVYNLLGQKVKTVYQGLIPAGTQRYNVNLTGTPSSNLIYRLTVNGNQVSGKLLHAKE